MATVTAKTTNSTTTYETITVSTNVKIDFTKVVNSSGTTIYGKITNNGAENGSIAYDERSNYLNVSLKPYNKFSSNNSSSGDVATLFANLWSYVHDVLIS